MIAGIASRAHRVLERINAEPELGEAMAMAMYYADGNRRVWGDDQVKVRKYLHYAQASLTLLISRGVFGDEVPMREPKDELRPLSNTERATVGKERLQHGEVQIVKRPIADTAGGIGAPYVAVSALALMERNGTITAEHRRAGERFHELFRLAALDGLRAADMGRIPGAASLSSYGAHGNERARRRIAEIMTLLGGEGSIAASVAWHVLGLDVSLRQWANHALRRNHSGAGGVLLAVLAVIEPMMRD